MNPLRNAPHPHLLQISVRPWLNALSREAGGPVTLAEVSDEFLDSLRANGFHGVWLMGVWETGPDARRCALEHADLLREYERILPDWEPRDVGGSPYSIRAYRVAPRIGTNAALDSLRHRLNERGLGLVLDFVPNHVSRDHPWLAKHPDRFVRGSARDLVADPGNWFVPTSVSGEAGVFAHGRDPYFPGWTDTAQIDYRDPNARHAMTALLADLASRCDGLRCDMAMLLLPDVFHSTWGAREADPWDFWAEAIRELRQRTPETVLIAEVYWGLESRLIEAGFDFTYDKDFYDMLVRSDRAAIRARLEAPLEKQRSHVRFLENHDEPRAMATFGEERLRAASALAYALPGLRFFQDGQEEGRRIRLPVQLVRAPLDEGVASCREFHERLFRLLADEVFQRGEWSPLAVGAEFGHDPPPDSVLGSQWVLDDELRAVAANLADGPQRARLHLPLAEAGPDPVRIEDEISGESFEQTRRESREVGFLVEIAPYGARFLKARR